jgi:UDP-N-acetylmuramyl tripeptide synthase
MPLFATLLVGKAVLYLSRLTGRGGSALPGLIAERLDRKILAKLGGRLGEVILITGTNGKTTTTKMLVTMIRDCGRPVITNRTGSNLSRGLVSTLVERTSLMGRPKSSLGVFEVDEATLPAAVEALKPSAVVVLNLFRDQLDRYGELDAIAAKMKRSLYKHRPLLILNADDPLVASLGLEIDKRVRYFGIESAPVKKLDHDQASDSDHCPLCGEALNYRTRFFSHIGHYVCPSGHFMRPKPDLSAKVELDEVTEAELSTAAASRSRFQASTMSITL